MNDKDLKNKDAGAPQNLPRGDGNSPDKSEVSKDENTNNKDTKATVIRALAVIGIVALILIGLYGTSRVVANLPDAGRSIAAGFVSVTSQFFGADEDEEEDVTEPTDEEDEDEDQEEDVDDEDQDSQDSEDESDGDTTPTTPTQTTRTEYRIVQQPTSFGGPQASDPNGDVDLEVTILAIGKIHPQKKTFIEQDVLDEDDTGAVRFQVKNVGTKTSEEWRYRADLPTDPSHTYDSDDQIELKPGERVEYTLSFDSLSERNNELSIEVDPGRRIDDVERDNNRIEIDLDIRD